MKKIGEDVTYMECYSLLVPDNTSEMVSTPTKVQKQMPAPFTPPDETFLEADPKAPHNTEHAAPCTTPVSKFDLSLVGCDSIPGPLTATPLHGTNTVRIYYTSH